MEQSKAITTKEELLNAIILEAKKEELAKNNVLVKDGAFTLTEKVKKALEKELGRSFSKNRFSSKNELLYNAVKEQLEQLGFTVFTEAELLDYSSKKLAEEAEELAKEAEAKRAKAEELAKEAEKAKQAEEAEKLAKEAEAKEAEAKAKEARKAS